MGYLLGGFLFAVMFLSVLLGQMSDPWFAWRVQGGADQAAAPQPIVSGVAVDGENLVPVRGRVSDVQRYQLARAAGWSAQDAITATAISIAENGSGDPAALSGVNFNGSRDLGLWQVNSGWWAKFGGQQALIDPLINARAGFTIYGLQGWCAWSTYEASCGTGHTGAYRSFLNRAQTAAAQPIDPRQA